ncbi:MAG: [protein-PII] uridylyltransferase [Rhizobiaceae bacterium]
MNAIALNLDKMIDGAALRRDLSALVKQHGGDGSGHELRQAVLEVFKSELQRGRGLAETLLMKDRSGQACAARISHHMDELIRVLYDFTVTHVYRSTNPSAAERIAIVAVGGYGRGTLAPGSDIDLLFLLPYKQTPWGEQIVEYMLYMLWDMRLKVGHATRNIDECVRLSRTDITIRTAVLEARYIWGAEDLYTELKARFDREVVAGTGPEFIQAKLTERDHRHLKQGESRYKVEPNVKDGKGGLRDLHTLFWIGKYFYRVHTGEELIDKGVFTAEEHVLFKQAEGFLWAVRCHMHFLTGKAEERLHFDIQREIASRMGFSDGKALSGVERFMKEYFLTAKQVGDLTRIFCTVLEVEQAKHVPGFNRLFRTFSRRRRKLAGAPGFIVDNHRINVADDLVFEADPVNLLRLFWLADKHGFELHPNALKLVTRSAGLVSRKLRGNEEANRLFLECLTSSRNPELNLRRMNEAGLLGKLIPDFDRIVAMMQFSMYHHYTVDEHLLRCIGVLSEIEHGDGEKIHPLSHKLIPELTKWRNVLYVAVLFHDIAKGLPVAHEVAGAEVARKRCPHMGLSDTETEMVAWLVEQHLSMSMIAQSRDLNDRKTIEDFAAIVQSVERLKLLLVLTVCDIRGVGPGVFNGWKGQLLRTLYYETELLLSGGFSEEKAAERVERARIELAGQLEDWPESDRSRYRDLHYSNYMLIVDPQDQLRHARFVREADQAGKKLATMVRTHEFHAVTEITVLTADHPRLLSVITGACSAAGGNIVDAQIFTTRDGRALDTILISREFDRDEDELRRGKRVCQMIEDVLSGQLHLPEIIEKRLRSTKTVTAFDVESRAEIRNTLSHKFSVIEVQGHDKPGLLSAITGAISDLSLDIASAHITTFGEKVIDTFYVTDLVGQKIEDAQRQKKIKDHLLEILEGDEKQTGKSESKRLAGPVAEAEAK